MSFFDTYQDVGGGDYISADEKQVLLEEGIPFAISDVIYEETSQFGNPRYVLKVVAPTGEDGEDEVRLLAFTADSVWSRDRMLKAIQEYIDETGEAVTVKLDKVGKSYLLISPDAEATPQTKAGRGGTATRSRRK